MIRQLQLQNFKSFQDTTVPLGPFTLLVGTNASGKTNLSDALKFLHGCASGYTFIEVVDGKWGQGGTRLWSGLRGGFKELAYRDSNSCRFGIHLDLSDGQGAEYVLGIALNPGNRRPIRLAEEHLTIGGQEIISSSDGPPNASMPSFRIGRVPAKFFSPPNTVLWQLGRTQLEFPAETEKAGRIIEALQQMRFLDLAPHAMREPSTPGQLILGDRGENLSSVLLDICEDSKCRAALLGWLRALTPMDVQDLAFKEDFQGRVLVHLVDSNGLETSAYSASDGTLRFLALAATLLSPDSGHFYFFEEIDNGIHPTRLHILLDVLEQASREMGCQIVATTHNPQLLAFLSKESREDAVLLYRREGSFASEARRIMELPGIEKILETQNLSNLFASGWLEDAVEFTDEESPETRTTVSATA